MLLLKYTQAVNAKTHCQSSLIVDQYFAKSVVDNFTSYTLENARKTPTKRVKCIFFAAHREQSKAMWNPLMTPVR